jgi:kanamycin kinase
MLEARTDADGIRADTWTCAILRREQFARREHAPEWPLPCVVMEEPDFTRLADLHALGDEPVPQIVHQVAEGRPVELVWRNDLGGLTFRIDDTFLKWNPRSTGIDLDRERTRLNWISTRHPAPRVIRFGMDGDAQWLLTAGLGGGPAVGDQWRARRSEAIAAIATGLRAIHALPTDDFPTAWTSQAWVGRRPASLEVPPLIEQPVLVHGDACAPNTLISDEGHWVGHVDFGDLAIGDMWADLAIASLSLDWNFGEGHHDELFDAYGVAPDAERISYYRALWEAAS